MFLSQHARLWASEARVTGALSKGGKMRGVVFAFEEGISTSHVCLKGQQPYFLELWKLCYLNFYFFLFF